MVILPRHNPKERCHHGRKPAGDQDQQCHERCVGDSIYCATHRAQKLQPILAKPPEAGR